jgi:methylated-DNA-[protein]-cysteine S-methyltransferase
MKNSFAERVRTVVKGIRQGKTMTYGQVAAAAGCPGAARAVGNIMAANQDRGVPCHRVVRADGTAGKYNGLRGQSKEVLLAAEGAWK